MNDGRSRNVLLLVAACAVLIGCGAKQQPTDSDASATAAAAPAAPASSAEEPGMPVAGIEMPYGEQGERLLRGHFVYPENMVEPLPAVIVVHPWWGLDDVVKDAAAQLASRGYMVLAVDLYGGQVASSAQAAGELSRVLLEQPAQADANLLAAHSFLTGVAGAPAVATLGWGMGGYWSLKSQRLLPGELVASVVWYGQFDQDETNIAALDAPVLGLFAANDRSIPAQTVREFRATASQLGRDVEVFIYPNSGHDFANPDSQNYDAGVVADAWARTVSFLDAQFGRR